MYGETVFVEYADGTSKMLDNVLVEQTDMTDLTVLDVQMRFINQARYKGDTSTLTLCWPKTDSASDLNAAHVTIRGIRYRVYSDPMAFDHINCPTMWDRRVVAIRSLFLYDVELLASVHTQDEYGVWTQTFVSRPIKANLLRVAETLEQKSGRDDLSKLTMFEIPISSYNGESYLAFQGVRYEVKDTAYSVDNVVMTCVAPNNESSVV